jgi:PAS domain S-box-containing protein
MVDLEFEDYVLELSEKTDEAVFIVTVSGLILHCTNQAANLFGYAKSFDINGLHVRDLVPEDFAAFFPAEISEEHLTEGRFLKRVNKKKSGEHFPTYVRTEYIDISGDRYVLTTVRERLLEGACRDMVEKDKLLQNIELLKCELKKEKERVASLQNSQPAILNRKLCARLAVRYPELSQNDYRLASLLLQSIDTKSIAQRLNVTQNAVYVARKRLRKKLQIEKEKTIIQHLLEVLE